MTHVRRDFIKHLATAAGGVVLVPAITRCGGSKPPVETAGIQEVMTVPKAPPGDWDAVAFNKKRGAQGAIPRTYMASINGKDGVPKHLGKHLPYIPGSMPPNFGAQSAGQVPPGYLALMWGDPDKGYARHPNAKPGPENNHEGHWYNWIRIRKATAGEAEEVQSAYTSWPGTEPSDTGAYAVFGEGDIEADGGRNTVYLAGLPEDVSPGDTVRIWAHCLTHGEYVDFITV